MPINHRWNTYDGAKVTRAGDRVTSDSGKEINRLKCYINFDYWISEEVISNEYYSVMVNYSNLCDYELGILINGSTAKPIVSAVGFHGKITLTGKKVANHSFQLQIYPLDKTKIADFIYRNLMVTKSNKPSLYIPAKVDLKNPTLYPIDGEYTEIKAN